HCHGTLQERQERGDGGRADAGRRTGHKHRFVLDLFGKRSHELGTRLSDDLADLRQTERAGTLSERHFGDITARCERHLGFELVSDPELVENRSDVDASRAASNGIRVYHHAGGQHGALEFLGRTDLGLRCPRRDYDTDAGSTYSKLATRIDLA